MGGGFGAASTTDEVLRDVDLSGRRILDAGVLRNSRMNNTLTEAMGDPKLPHGPVVRVEF